MLLLHAKIYGLKRFTVDPYQIGKENSDGIHSGAFWIYYQAGFRPLQKEQRDLAASEEVKIKNNKGYRSPANVLKKLANSRMELVLKKTAVNFDATDLSRAYAGVVTKKFKGKRNLAEKDTLKKLADILGIKNYREENLDFVLKSWAVLLLSKERELRRNNAIKEKLKRLFVLKAGGSEEMYIAALQQAPELRKFLETVLKEYAG